MGNFGIRVLFGGMWARAVKQFRNWLIIGCFFHGGDESLLWCVYVHCFGIL